MIAIPHSSQPPLSLVRSQPSHLHLRAVPHLWPAAKLIAAECSLAREPSACHRVWSLSARNIAYNRCSGGTCRPRRSLLCLRTCASQSAIGTPAKVSDAPVTKKCLKCENSYPLRYFQISKTEAGGRFALCRGCVYEDKLRRKRAATGADEAPEAEDGSQEEVRQCINCHLQLPVNFFAIDVKNLSGRKYSCLTCSTEATQRGPQSRSPPTMSAVSKVCKGPCCKGSLQPTQLFSPNTTSRDGFSIYCRKCSAALKRKRYKILKEVPYGTVRPVPEKDAILRCGTCGDFKPVTQFYACFDMRSGRQRNCKNCFRKQMDECAAKKASQ